MRTRQEASVVKGYFLFQKKVHVLITTKNIILETADGLLGESLCVSLSNRSDICWTRLDKTTFAFRNIFLFSVNFLVLNFESE